MAATEYNTHLKNGFYYRCPYISEQRLYFPELKDRYRSCDFCPTIIRVSAEHRFLNAWSGRQEKGWERSSQKNTCHLKGMGKEEHAVARQPVCILHLEMLTASGTWASGLSLCDSDVALLTPLSSFFLLHPRYRILQKFLNFALSIDLFASSCPR